MQECLAVPVLPTAVFLGSGAPAAPRPPGVRLASVSCWRWARPPSDWDAEKWRNRTPVARPS